jgi:hypothetical protein
MWKLSFKFQFYSYNKWNIGAYNMESCMEMDNKHSYKLQMTYCL